MCIVCDNSIIDPSTIYLDCSQCSQVTSLPDNLPALKFLIIYDTNIQTIPPYPLLEGLYMMNCPIVSLPDLPKLTKLNAKGSKLENISDKLYRLQTIMIDNTPIQSLPNTLISAVTISANDCNQLTDISSKLINLESLSIINTSIDTIPSLMSLQYINIGGTSIKQVPVDKLPCLRKVFARGCNLNDPFSMIELGIDLTN